MYLTILSESYNRSEDDTSLISGNCFELQEKKIDFNMSAKHIVVHNISLKTANMNIINTI